MEKKIKVQIGERSVWIMPHMLKDAEKFGATTEKRVLREVPRELIKRVEPLPKMEQFKPPEVILKDIRPVESVPVLLEKPKRKTPVKSKSKK
jgi:hypothetical protein